MKERLSGIEIEPGVSLPLSERKLALTSLAAVYSNYARARGLKTTLKTAAGRGELSKRYDDPAKLATATMDKAKAGLRTESDEVACLMKSDELIAIGFDAGDVEMEALKMAIELRHKIGVEMGAKVRKKFVEGLYDPAEDEIFETDGTLF